MAARGRARGRFPLREPAYKPVVRRRRSLTKTPSTTVAVGQATETGTLFAVTAGKRRAIEQCAATDTALTVTRAKARATGQATEAGTAQPVGLRLVRAVNPAAETCTALGVSGGTVRRSGAGRVLSLGTRGRERGRFPLRGKPWRPQSITSRSWPGVQTGRTLTTTVTVGQAAETDTARNLIASAKVITVGQATETNGATVTLRARRYRSGFPFPIDTVIAGPFVVAAQSVEFELAQTVTHAKRKTLGQTADTEASFGVGAIGAKVITVGLAVEQQAAHTATRRKTRTTAQATGTDTAASIAHTKRLTVREAAEAEAARPVAPARLKGVGQALETGSAQPATRVSGHAIGQALEFESAGAHSRLKRREIGQVTENQSARPVTPSGRDVIVVEVALSGEVSQPVTASKHTSIGLPQGNETAFPVTHRKTVTFTGAEETDFAPSTGSDPTLTVRVGIAAEVATARQITLRGGVSTFAPIKTGEVHRPHHGTAKGGHAGTAIKGGVLIP